MLHQNSQFYRYLKYYNLSPGMLVKYFNGIEQNLPIKEKFIEVERFTISKDGFNIVIQGLSLEENSAINGKLLLKHGLYIYEISKEDIRKVSLMQFIPFAQISPSNPPEELKRLEFDLAELD
jgi:hypothetical protein